MNLANKIQGGLLSRPALMQTIMSRVPATTWERMGKQRALKLARRMAKEVPAYRRVLREVGLDPDGTLAFEDLPILTKKGYIVANQDRGTDLVLGDFPRAHCLTGVTSGTTGQPLQWPTPNAQQALLTFYMAGVLQEVWQAHEVPTAFLSGFALGNYVGTNTIMYALIEAQMRFRLDMMLYTPGENIEEILRNLTDTRWAPDWVPEQRIILTFPGTLEMVLDAGDEMGIDWPALNLKVWSGGQLITNTMRANFANRLGHRDDDLTSFVITYGSGDTGGPLGSTTLVTRLLELLAQSDVGLAKDLFGQTLQVPLLRINPLSVNVEEGPDQHLLVSAAGGIPVVRYDINDRGVVISWSHVARVLEDHGIDLRSELRERGYPSRIVKWPLLVLYGRTDEVAIANSMKFFLEHITQALADWEFGGSISDFRHQGGTLRYTVHLELVEGRVLAEAELLRCAQDFVDIFKGMLDELNDDWRGLAQVVKDSMEPIVKIWPHGTGPFTTGEGKTLHLLPEDWGQ